jgi:hypothetical protein
MSLLCDPIVLTILHGPHCPSREDATVRRWGSSGFTALERRACPISSWDRSADGVRCHRSSFVRRRRTDSEGRVRRRTLVDPNGCHAMPGVPGMHPRNEPTFSTYIELDNPCRTSGLGAAPQAGEIAAGVVPAGSLALAADRLRGGCAARTIEASSGRNATPGREERGFCIPAHGCAINWWSGACRRSSDIPDP